MQFTVTELVRQDKTIATAFLDSVNHHMVFLKWHNILETGSVSSLKWRQGMETSDFQHLFLSEYQIMAKAQKSNNSNYNILLSEPLGVDYNKDHLALPTHYSINT